MHDTDQAMRMSQANSNKQDKEKVKKVGYSDILKYYHPKSMLVLALGSSVFVSVTMPIFGLLVSLYVFALQDYEDTDEWWDQKRNLDLYFFFLCFGIGFFTFIQKVGYAIGGENLITTVRNKLYEEMIFKHVGWFDDKNRAVGVLSTIFAEDI